MQLPVQLQLTVGILTCIIAFVGLLTNSRTQKLKKQTIRPYKVTVLGPSSSGKTVFLASMYNRLSVLRSEIGFSLSVEPELRRKLVQIYRELEDPTQEFPRATQLGETTIYQFTCCVPSTTLYKVLEFIYLDYAGEKLINPGSQDIDAKIKEADILLGLIDGEKLFDSLNGDHQARRRLAETFANILPIMQASEKPVHFIITKYDLFLSKHIGLKQIVDFLKSSLPDFKDFVEAYSTKDHILRIIPVSAIGKEFAIRRNGIMEKIPDGKLAPLLVEMPLICILPDYFSFKHKSLNKQTVRLLARLADINKRMNLFTWLVRLITIVQLTLRFYHYLMANGAGQFTNVNLSQGLFDHLRATPPPALLGTKEIQNQKLALSNTINHFIRRLDDFEKQFPSSKLSGSSKS